MPTGLIVVLLLFALIAAFVTAFTRSPFFKGRIGEFIVNLGTRLFLDKSTYHLVKNVTLPTEDGTTQIDHILVSRYGIFVTETKNMNGAISGGEDQPQWTQAFGRNKFRFQNPLHQNYKHTRTLADIVDVPHDVVKPIVLFVGDAKLKTEMPRNVMTHGYAGYVRSFKEVLLTEEEVDRVLRVIDEKRLAPGFKTHREHVRHVRQIVEERRRSGEEQGRGAPHTTPQPPSKPGSVPPSPPPLPIERVRTMDPGAPEQPPACPRCGLAMVLRTAKRGKNAGCRFWGCPRYPQCGGLVNVD